MSSQEEDATYGVPFVNACWALTAVVSVTLIFRYVVKAWASYILPKVSSPMRIWGAEDLLFLTGYAFDISHIVYIQKSLDWGLGRHVWFLKDQERILAMKYDFISQPLAVAASMFSRCGMTWFLYTCFSSADKHIRIIILVGMVVQIVANSVTILQIVLQCGPNPYRLVDRTAYFHYMWDGTPSDGSVTCQSPNVQTTIGFVQGGFNTTVDFALTILSAMQLWQFSIRATDAAPSGHGTSFISRFKRMPRQARNRRIWQTIILSGPLALSGCASIVKTYLLKSLGERNDFTHNIITFILWVKIENYSILLATCGPIIRLFVRVVFDSKKPAKWGYWSSGGGGNPANGYGQSHSHGHSHGRGLALDGGSHTQNQGSVVMTVFADKGEEGMRGRGRGRVGSGSGSGGSDNDGIEDGRSSGGIEGAGRGVQGVTVKTDITVHVDEDGASTTKLVRSRYS
ncbi:hypothetical protein BJX68DRAFT_264991 [Aspergillus pseudodeflectus]|uniref:Rhodopsin domain-containing protein n=1 Tax=Aspergillus pseudodeflectus TaxID=176178 RepID=A0ABR4KMN0_9EURO